MTSVDNLPVPAEYQQSSQRLCVIWEELVDRAEKTGYEITKMVKILESNGYNRTKAIEKIILDHSHLKGFSRRTIYRELPEEMKRQYNDVTNMLPTDSHVPNDTFEKSQQIDVNDVISTNLNEQSDEQSLNFKREYLSKDNSKIQEYECQFVYNDVILPLSVTLNVTKEKIISMVLDNDKFKLLNKTLLNNKTKK